MPDWQGILAEIQKAGSAADVVRRKYLAELHRITGRNVIIYYSGWLQKGAFLRQSPVSFQVNDSDKNGFMTAVHGLDRTKGLDLVLHTPGGSTGATESLVHYLREMFGTDIRAIIPQLAMSAGTIIACACKEIIMGKHSSLGPIDPQLGGVAAHGIVEEFKRAAEEIRRDQTRIPIWQPIIAKYSPTLIGEAEKAISWSEEMVEEFLTTGMFASETQPKAMARHVVEELGSHSLTKSHDRHISPQRAGAFGLKVTKLEDNAAFQDAVLSIHHACLITFSSTLAIKVIENHDGVAYIEIAQMAAVTLPTV